MSDSASDDFVRNSSFYLSALCCSSNPPPNWFSDFDCNEGPVYYKHIFSEWRKYPDEGHMIPADSSVDRPWHCNRCFWPVWEPFEAPDYCCWWCNRQLATLRQQELDESAQATDNVHEHAEINDDVRFLGLLRMSYGGREPMAGSSGWVLATMSVLWKSLCGRGQEHC